MWKSSYSSHPATVNVHNDGMVRIAGNDLRQRIDALKAPLAAYNHMINESHKDFYFKKAHAAWVKYEEARKSALEYYNSGQHIKDMQEYIDQYKTVEINRGGFLWWSWSEESVKYDKTALMEHWAHLKAKNQFWEFVGLRYHWFNNELESWNYNAEDFFNSKGDLSGRMEEREEPTRENSYHQFFGVYYLQSFIDDDGREIHLKQTRRLGDLEQYQETIDVEVYMPIGHWNQLINLETLLQGLDLKSIYETKSNPQG